MVKSESLISGNDPQRGAGTILRNNDLSGFFSQQLARKDANLLQQKREQETKAKADELKMKDYVFDVSEAWEQSYSDVLLGKQKEYNEFVINSAHDNYIKTGRRELSPEAQKEEARRRYEMQRLLDESNDRKDAWTKAYALYNANPEKYTPESWEQFKSLYSPENIGKQIDYPTLVEREEVPKADIKFGDTKARIAYVKNENKEGVSTFSDEITDLIPAMKTNFATATPDAKNELGAEALDYGYKLEDGTPDINGYIQFASKDPSKAGTYANVLYSNSVEGLRTGRGLAREGEGGLTLQFGGGSGKKGDFSYQSRVVTKDITRNIGGQAVPATTSLIAANMTYGTDADFVINYTGGYYDTVDGTWVEQTGQKYKIKNPDFEVRMIPVGGKSERLVPAYFMTGTDLSIPLTKSGLLSWASNKKVAVTMDEAKQILQSMVENNAEEYAALDYDKAAGDKVIIKMYGDGQYYPVIVDKKGNVKTTKTSSTPKTKTPPPNIGDPNE